MRQLRFMNATPMPRERQHDWVWPDCAVSAAKEFLKRLAGWVLSMSERIPGLFEGTEMPTAGWWEALWPDPARVLQTINLAPGMDVVDLCSGDGWFTFYIAKIAWHVSPLTLTPHCFGLPDCASMKPVFRTAIIKPEMPTT
jgi:hypothetical protein